MTSQVIIMNLYGAAVASDSMITFSTANTEGSFDSFDKTFSLGGDHNIACLISDSAEFAQIPWPVIIEAWKRDLQDLPPLATVDDYLAHLVSWLPSQDKLFTATQQSKELLRAALAQYRALSSHISFFFEEEGRELGESMGVADQTRVEELVEDFHQLCSRFDAYDLVNEQSDAADEKLIRGMREEFTAVAKDDLFFLDQIDGVQQVLYESIPAASIRNQQPETQSTKVALIGYGKEEVFPHIVTAYFDTLVNDLPRHTIIDHYEVNADRPSFIIGFAQRDEIYAFIEGIHRDVSRALPDALEEFLLDRIGHRFNETEIEELLSSAKAHVTNFMDEFQQERVDPLYDSIEAMPLVKMAELAKSLIGIQVLRSATEYEPTVGGEIGVAVVTKTQGVQFVS